MPTIADSLDLVQVVNELVGNNPQGASFAVCLVAAEFSLPEWGADRARTYSGSRSAVLADLVADGILEGTAVHGAVGRMLAQKSASPSVVVGRRDPTDISWTQALTAIRAADASFYGLYLADERTAAGILDAATWATSAGMLLLVAETADADVYGDVAGNLSEDLAALVTTDNAGRVVLSWHDPATASGAAAPTVTIEGDVSGYDLTPGGTLGLSVDGGAEQVFTLTAAAATVLGSNAGPFNSADGEHLDVEFDNSGTTLVVTFDADFAAVASGTETFDLSGAIGGTVEVVTDSGTDSYVLASGVAPDLPTPATTSAAELVANFNNYITGTVATSSAAGGVVTFRSITAGTSARFRFTGSTSSVFLSALGLNTDEVAGDGNVADVDAVTTAEIVALASAAYGSAGTAASDAGALRLTGRIAGTDGKVDVKASSTAGLLTALGLSSGATAGTGVVGNAAAITPAALSTLLDGAFSSVTVTLDDPDITITGTTGLGYYHTLLFTGPLRSELGLPKGLIRGDGVEEDYAGAAILGARMGIDIDTRGLVSWDWCPLLGCYGDTIPLNVSERLRRDQNVCTVEYRSRTDSRPQFHDGRLVAPLVPTGEPVYADARIGIDWLAVRQQEAFLNAFEALANAGEAISYTDRDARPFVASVLKGPLELAAQRGVISEADLTPPDPATGKLTGLTIAFLADIGSASRALRRWEVTSNQAGAGKLQGLSLINKVTNA